VNRFLDWNGKVAVFCLHAIIVLGLAGCVAFLWWQVMVGWPVSLLWAIPIAFVCWMLISVAIHQERSLSAEYRRGKGEYE